MGFIKLQDGTIIHGSQLPNLNPILSYTYSLIQCEKCNGYKEYHVMMSSEKCKCKKS